MPTQFGCRSHAMKRTLEESTESVPRKKQCLETTSGDIERILKLKDHYAIINVSREATLSEIKKAYRKQCKLFHPDRCSLENAEEAFKRILKAFEILSDPQERAYFDCGSPSNQSEDKFWQGKKQKQEKRPDPPLKIFTFPDEKELPFHLHQYFGIQCIHLPEGKFKWNIETKVRVLSVYGLKLIRGGILPKEVYHPNIIWNNFPLKWAFIDWPAYSEGRFGFSEFLKKLDLTMCREKELNEIFACFCRYMSWPVFIHDFEDLSFSTLITVMEPVLKIGVIKLKLSEVFPVISGPIFDSEEKIVEEYIMCEQEKITNNEIRRLVALQILPFNFFNICGRYCPSQIEEEKKLFERRFSWMKLQAGKNKKRKLEIKQKKKSFKKRAKTWVRVFRKNQDVVNSWIHGLPQNFLIQETN